MIASNYKISHVIICKLYLTLGINTIKKQLVTALKGTNYYFSEYVEGYISLFGHYLFDKWDMVHLNITYS